MDDIINAAIANPLVPISLPFPDLIRAIIMALAAVGVKVVPAADTFGRNFFPSLFIVKYISNLHLSFR